MTIQQDIQKALHSEFPEGEIEIHFDGKLLTVEITDKVFEGLSKVRQQQLVNKILSPWVLNKTVHAVTLKLGSSCFSLVDDVQVIIVYD